MTARKQFLLRIDPDLWADLERWATSDLRSVNAQVEWLLREAVRRHKGSLAVDLASTPAGARLSAVADAALRELAFKLVLDVTRFI